MSKGDLNLEINKKPVEIQMPREAEDIKLNRNVDLLMERPAELNVVSEHDFSKVLNNPLVNREMKRRKAEAGEDAEWNYQKEMVDQSLHEIVNKAEKNWVATEMDKLTERAEKRREQERRQKEEQERLEQEHKEQEEQAKQKRRERELVEKKREKLFVDDNLILAPKRLQVHMPEKTALSLKYSEKFSNSIGDKKRKEKQRNKKSRLFQKLKNVELLNNNIVAANNLIYKRIRDQIGRDDDIGAEDFNDLAQFMIYKDKYKNQEISELMLGARNEEGHRSVDAYHARLALTKMADQLLDVDVFSLKFDTDHDIAVNASQLESLANRLAAFDRLSAKYKYMESLPQGKRLELNSKLRALSSVAAYYVMRRDIITNDIYKNHYDHELTMDVTKAAAKDASPKDRKAERELAEKLVKSYILGRNMLRINGVPVKTIDKMRDPRFKNAEAVNFLNKVKADYEEQSDKSDQNIMKLVKAGYAKTDERAGDLLSELQEAPVILEDADALLERSVENDEEAMLVEEQQKVKNTFAGNVYKTLLTSDELSPLKGTREMGAVKNSIQALQAMLSSNMPGFDKTTGKDRKAKTDSKYEENVKDDIDGTCIAIVMLYKRLTDNIDSLVKRYGSAYGDLASMLTGLSDQCKKESESFREKTLEFHSIMRSDNEQKNRPHTWMEALSFNRGVYYDLDNDKSLKVDIDGAGASKVYKITKKVPVTEENPAGEEIVYFRTKDKVPPADDDELVAAVIERHEVSKETAKQISDVLHKAKKFRLVYDEIYNTIKELKKVKADPKIVANNVITLIKHDLTVELNIPKEEYEVVGQIFLDWRDDRAKRCMAHDMRKSAHIDCGRNLSDRNVATSRLAKIFGIESMICDSRTAYVTMNGKVLEGNLMENTGGKSTLDIQAGYTINAISQIFMMQIFDYICGQTDRHFGNFHGVVMNGGIDKIRCLDNDMALGKLKSTHIGDEGLNRILPITDEGLMGLPMSFVNRLMAIDRSYINQVVGDILNQEELDAFEERLDSVRSRIIEMANRRQDTNWDEKTRKLSYVGEKGDDQLRQLWALQMIAREAISEDLDMCNISRFTSDIYGRTNTSALMKARKQELTAQNQKKKTKKK